MASTLKELVPKVWPEAVFGVDWIPVYFQGKKDLERNICPKMKNWNYGDPHFIILRDQDGADCKALKQALTKLAENGEKPFQIRIVCQELESWFLGDLDAVETAYPESKASKQSGIAKFRQPDKLTNASDELKKLTGASGKVGRAASIAKHLDPTRNKSHSFGVLLNTLNGLASS